MDAGSHRPAALGSSLLLTPADRECQQETARAHADGRPDFGYLHAEFASLAEVVRGWSGVIRLGAVAPYVSDRWPCRMASAGGDGFGSKAGLGREGEEQRLVAGQVREDGRQQLRRAGVGAHLLEVHTGQGQESGEPLRLAG